MNQRSRFWYIINTHFNVLLLLVIWLFVQGLIVYFVKMDWGPGTNYALKAADGVLSVILYAMRPTGHQEQKTRGTDDNGAEGKKNGSEKPPP